MSKLRNRLREHRAAAGVSQEELARRVGISRQALSAIELAQSIPSTSVALRLGRALGAAVETLFAEGPPERIEVRLVAGPNASPPPRRAFVGRVQGHWIAHALSDDAPLHADGLVVGRGARARVDLLQSLSDLEANVFVAGCAPTLGLLRGGSSSGTALRWLPASSETALALLAAGEVHVAGTHVLDERTGEYNVALARARLPGQHVQLVELVRWEAGLAFPRRLRLRSMSDLARPGIRVAIRPTGSGARALFDREAGRIGWRPKLRGAIVARSHEAAADAVAFGAADAAITLRAFAEARGLAFLPLAEERFDLVLTDESRALPEVTRLIEAISARAFRREASVLPGYDAGHAGRVVAELR